MEISFRVPDAPSVLDFQVAFKKQLESRHISAMEDAFTAELDVANAQRIAIHKRELANRLKEELDHAERELSVLAELAAAGKIRPIPGYPQAVNPPIEIPSLP